MLETLYRTLIMLPCKNCRRYEDSTLLSVLHALECRTPCHLGLAEADISAEKSVHRRRLLHILLYLDDGAQLIVRFRVVETLLEIDLHIIVLGKCMTGGLAALCIQRNKLISHILDGFLDL